MTTIRSSDPLGRRLRERKVLHCCNLSKERGTSSRQSTVASTVWALSVVCSVLAVHPETVPV
jgi:hypothetical protein